MSNYESILEKRIAELEQQLVKISYSVVPSFHCVYTEETKETKKQVDLICLGLDFKTISCVAYGRPKFHVIKNRGEVNDIPNEKNNQYSSRQVMQYFKRINNNVWEGKKIYENNNTKIIEEDNIENIMKIMLSDCGYDGFLYEVNSWLKKDSEDEYIKEYLKALTGDLKPLTSVDMSNGQSYSTIANFVNDGTVKTIGGQQTNWILNGTV